MKISYKTERHDMENIVMAIYDAMNDAQTSVHGKASDFVEYYIATRHVNIAEVVLFISRLPTTMDSAPWFVKEYMHEDKNKVMDFLSKKQEMLDFFSALICSLIASKKDDRYFSMEDLANKLSMNRETIRILIRNGELEAYQIGSRYRISESSFKKFLAKNKTLTKKERRFKKQQDEIEERQEPKTEASHELKPEKKAEQESDPKPEPKSEPKVEPKSESKPEPKTEPKAESNPAPKIEPKPDEIKTEPKTESKPETKPESKPQDAPPEPIPEKKNSPALEPKEAIESAAQPEPATDNKPAADNIKEGNEKKPDENAQRNERRNNHDKTKNNQKPQGGHQNNQQKGNPRPQGGQQNSQGLIDALGAQPTFGFTNMFSLNQNQGKNNTQSKPHDSKPDAKPPTTDAPKSDASEKPKNDASDKPESVDPKTSSQQETAKPQPDVQPKAPEEKPSASEVPEANLSPVGAPKSEPEQNVSSDSANTTETAAPKEPLTPSTPPKADEPKALVDNALTEDTKKAIVDDAMKMALTEKKDDEPKKDESLKMDDAPQPRITGLKEIDMKELSSYLNLGPSTSKHIPVGKPS